MVLERIVARVRAELEPSRLPLSDLEQRLQAQAPPLDLAAALRGPWPRLIAEVKRASPSRGLLRANLDPVSLATTYVDNGAAAVSVLTEAHYFQGSLHHLEAIRHALDGRPQGRVPLLRKDFIIDPYQVYQARACGADAFLLLVAILEPPQLRHLLHLGHELGMQALVEVHTRQELEIALEAGARLIGINNRDLHTFQVDLAVTERLCPLVPRGRVVVSESGIATRADVERVARAGAHAVLVGEALVTAPDVAARVRELA